MHGKQNSRSIAYEKNHAIFLIYTCMHNYLSVVNVKKLQDLVSTFKQALVCDLQLRKH